MDSCLCTTCSVLVLVGRTVVPSLCIDNELEQIKKEQVVDIVGASTST